VAVISQQGAGWGAPIVWVGLLLVLVGLGLLAKEARNGFSATPAWDDDRSGLRSAIAGFLRGRPALAAVLLLLLAVGVGSSVGAALPSVEEEGARSSGIPSNWAGVEPLLPLVPSLKDIAALKGTAAGEASRVLAAESGALRVRALPEGAGGGARVAAARAPSGRPRPTAVGAPEPTTVRVPSVRRILATRVVTAWGVTNDLREIVENDLRNLPGLPIDINIDIDIDIDIPRIDPDRPSIRPIGRNPLPGGFSVPGIPGLRAPLNLTVVDSQADSRFDVLLVARGRRLVEAYRFRDRDIAGLAAEINLRSTVLVADLLRDGRRLARVIAAPLRSDPAGAGSGLLGTGLAAGDAARGGAGIGAGPASLATARSDSNGRPGARSRRGGRLGGRSPDARRSSPSSSSSSGARTPRLSTAPRRSTPTRPRRSSIHPKPKKLKPRKDGGRPNSSRPRRGGRSSGHGKGHGKDHKGAKGHGKHDDD
jgi:hypothetical protein